MMVVIPKSGQYPRYYYYMLQTLEFSSFVNPGAVPSPSGTAVGKQAVSNVPLAAQKSICDHLDAICETLDALSSRIEGSLGLLNERRSALISAAVTGKLELQGAN
jgi:type I restriction enzyme S subunit